MTDTLIPFVESMDRCWLEHRFDDLSAFLAPDVVAVSPDSAARLDGLAAAIESDRSLMARAKVAWFAARDHIVTERGDTAIVEYRWDMAWRSDGPRIRQADARSWFSPGGIAVGGSSGGCSFQGRPNGQRT